MDAAFAGVDEPGAQFVRDTRVGRAAGSGHDRRCFSPFALPANAEDFWPNGRSAGRAAAGRRALAYLLVAERTLLHLVDVTLLPGAYGLFSCHRARSATLLAGFHRVP